MAEGTRMPPQFLKYWLPGGAGAALIDWNVPGDYERCRAPQDGYWRISWTWQCRMRTCEWCGADITGRRQDARFCSVQHKKNAGSKRHRERNPGYYAKYADSPARLAWREANAESIRAKAREKATRYRQDHPEAAAAWAANPEKHRLYQARRRAAKLSQAFAITERDIRRLMHRYRGMCAYCETGPATHFDHVLALKRGGRHGIGNLLPACAHCNHSKSARLLYPWSVTRRLTAYFNATT